MTPEQPIAAAAPCSPVLETDDEGTKRWTIDGVLHREDGPAVEYTDGTKEWWLHGQRHREDGPAVQWADGDEEWFVHGLHHRDDGPAFQRNDGTKEWWYNDEGYTKSQWIREVLADRPLTANQHKFLDALAENWEGTPDLLYETVTNLAD